MMKNPPDNIVKRPRRVHASIPSESEHQVIIDWLKANDVRLYHCWQVMAVLGARLGDVLIFRTITTRELLNDEYNEYFDFYEMKRINAQVHFEKKAKRQNRKPPTIKARRIPITKTVRKVLTQAVTYAESIGSEFLIPSLTKTGRYRGNAMCRPSASRRFKQEFDALRKSRKKSIRPHIKAHSARKLFCSRILKKTGDWLVVQKAIGHRSLHVTRLYLKEIADE